MNVKICGFKSKSKEILKTEKQGASSDINHESIMVPLGLWSLPQVHYCRHYTLLQICSSMKWLLSEIHSQKGEQNRGCCAVVKLSACQYWKDRKWDPNWYTFQSIPGLSKGSLRWRRQWYVMFHELNWYHEGVYMECWGQDICEALWKMDSKVVATTTKYSLFLWRLGHGFTQVHKVTRWNNAIELPTIPAPGQIFDALLHPQ